MTTAIILINRILTVYVWSFGHE